MKVCVAAGVMLAGLLAAGCTHEAASARRATVQSCTRFGITALKHHVTVTSLPAACRGLTKAQVNSAADSALDAVISTVHGKVRMRARVLELSPLLVHLVNKVPAQLSPPPVPESSARRASGPSLGLVALVTWLLTVVLGFVMMAGWIARAGLRRTRTGQAGYVPAMNVAHFGLAMAGLVTWIIYLVTGSTSLAWIACALLLPVAGLGMALVSLWFPERSLSAAAVPAARTVPAAAGVVATQASLDPPPAQRPPALVVAVHVAFAVATILLTVLAAVGSG
jgi:hypothetical protein